MVEHGVTGTVSVGRKRQSHEHELESLRLQTKLDAGRHTRDLERIRLQAELNVKEIIVKGDVAEQGGMADAFLAAVKGTTKKSGVRWADAWNAIIRSSGATIALATWVAAMAAAGFVLVEFDKALISAFLGVFVGDRIANPGQAMIERLTALFALAKHFEGCHLTPYYCPAGVLTRGWGSTGPAVFPGRTWTQEYADMRLEQDAIRIAAGTLAVCPCLAQESDARLSAITDFAYNLGLGRLRASTLRLRINENQWENAGTELRRWIYGGGRKLGGLILRRAAEAALLAQNG